MTIINAWKAESTRGTTTFDTLYNFGGILPDNALPLDFSHDVEINSEEIQGQSYPSLTLGNRYNDKTTARFVPYHAKCLHWMLGAASDETTYVALDNYAAGTPKPSIGAFQQTTHEKFQGKGLVAQQLDLHHKTGMPLTAIESFMGMTHGVSTASPSTSDAGSEIRPFDVCSTLQWGNTDLFMDEIGFSFAHKIQGLPNGTGAYGSLIDTNSAIACVATVMCHGDISALYTDKDAGTARLLRYKVIKSQDSLQYIDIMSTAFIKAITPRYFFNVPDTAAVILQCGAVHCHVHDINKSFYGV